MNKSDTQNDLAILAASGGKGSGSSQDRLAALLEIKIGKELKEEQEKNDQTEAARLASVASARAAQRQREANQSNCPHLKPNFQSALGGQKDHSGTYHYLCQYCQKEFNGAVPHHLRIPGEMVGGPQN